MFHERLKLFYLPVLLLAHTHTLKKKKKSKKVRKLHWLTAARSIGFCPSDKIIFLQDVSDIKTLEFPDRFHIEFCYSLVNKQLLHMFGLSPRARELMCYRSCVSVQFCCQIYRYRKK